MKIITKHFGFINNLLGIRYRFLFFSLVAMLFLPSFFLKTDYHQVLTYLFQGFVLFAGIHAIQESKAQLYFGSLAGLLLLGLNWWGIFNDSATINFYLSFFIFMAFYTYLAVRLLMMIVKTHTVTLGVLFAAINVYLLIGIIGGYSFMLLENSVPGSLGNLSLQSMTDPTGFIYFSFITLSTLGYGDIIPMNPPARSIAMFLSILGPLYLTLLVAVLVGRYLNEHRD
jgi:hypothetical protein